MAADEPDPQGATGPAAQDWLSGADNLSAGGFYAFDRIGNATRFATDYFPAEAAGLNAAHTTRLFDAASVIEASRAMNAPFFA